MSRPFNGLPFTEIALPADLLPPGAHASGIPVSLRSRNLVITCVFWIGTLDPGHPHVIEAVTTFAKAENADVIAFVRARPDIESLHRGYRAEWDAKVFDAIEEQIDCSRSEAQGLVLAKPEQFQALFEAFVSPDDAARSFTAVAFGPAP